MFEIYKNARTEIRCTESEYKGKFYISIREYFLLDNGEWIPTKKGTTMEQDVWDNFTHQINLHTLSNFKSKK